MTAPLLRTVRRGSVRWIFLSRPGSRNALNEDLTAALESEVAEADSDSATKVIVLAGDGPSFCAGGDFRHFLAEDEKGGVVAFLTRLSALVTRIEDSPKPWVAALHGHAIAGGLELALACDVVIAAAGTQIGDGHVRNRLLPAAGSSVRLERAIGKGAARWLHLSGESMRAEELLSTGWIHEVVPPERFHDRTQQVAELLAERDSSVQQNMKRLLRSIESLEPREALAHELETFDRNWVDNHTASALREFLDARSTQPGRRNR